MKTILTQKLTITLTVEASDAAGNPSPVFAHGNEPTPSFQTAIMGPLTLEFATAAIERLQALRAQLEQQVNPPEAEVQDVG